MNLKNNKIWFIIPFIFLVCMNFSLHFVNVQMAAQDSSAWLGFPFRAYSYAGGMCQGGQCPAQYHWIMGLIDFFFAIVWPYSIYSLKAKELPSVVRWAIYLSFIPIILVSLYYLYMFFSAWY